MIKKLFTKDKIFIFICFFLLALIGLIFAIFYKNDINYMSSNSYIVLNDDNYNKSYHINNDGNIVSDNLFNVNDIWRDNTILDNGNYASNSSFYCFMKTLSSGTYTMSGWVSGNYVNISSSATTGQIISTLYQTNSSNSSFTFNVNGSTTFVFCFSKETNNIMLNSGSTALSYESYGAIWYKDINIGLIGNNNVFLNYIDAEYKNSNTYDYVSSLNSSYSSSYAITFLDVFSNSYSFSFSPDSIILFFDPIVFTGGLFFANYGVNLRFFEVDFYYNDTNVFTYTSDERDNTNNVYPFIIDDNFKFNKIIVRSSDFDVSNISSTYLSIGLSDSQDSKNYIIGYNDAHDDLSKTIDSLNNDIIIKNREIEDLNNTIDLLEEQAQTSLNGLTFTMISAVMSTPFNILHDYLNWNFFGINLFSLFTSLLTFLLVVWIIKFLLGRK